MRSISVARSTSSARASSRAGSAFTACTLAGAASALLLGGGAFAIFIGKVHEANPLAWTFGVLLALFGGVYLLLGVWLGRRWARRITAKMADDIAAPTIKPVCMALVAHAGLLAWGLLFQLG